MNLALNGGSLSREMVELSLGTADRAVVRLLTAT
jgi:hypothetical protein